MPDMEARRSARPWLIPMVMGAVRDYRWTTLERRMRLDYWIAYWNRSGDASVAWDDGSLRLGPDALVLIPPLVWIRRRGRGSFEQWWSHFTVPAQPACARPLRLPCAGSLGDLLDQGWQAAWRLGCQHPSTVAAWHAALGLALSQVAWRPPEPPASDEVITRLQADLLARGLPPVANAVLAHNLGMHEKSLCRRFRRATDTGLQEWLRQRRIDLAAAALADGQEVEAVATRFGFANRSHLTRVFTRSRGVGPGLFRRLAGAGTAALHHAQAGRTPADGRRR
jgi:AraC-like DNA-binding protein